MTDSKKIKDLRTHYGETLPEFADRLRVTRRTVINWEGGKQVPPVVMLLIDKLRSQEGL